jgi:hypothetical protein
VAEPDLALEGEGAQAEEAEGAVQDDTPEPIANLAKDMGWTPREEWQGEPQKWKPAEQFIRDGREIQQSTARELRAMREQVERIGGATSRIIQDKEAEINARWEAHLAQATEDGDTKAVLELAKQPPTASVVSRQNGRDPTVQQWIADNPWYEAHPRAKALATEISNRLAAVGEDTATQLKEAKAEVMQRYPELFGKPAKAPPGVQTAAARGAATNRVKGFAHMPAESQAAALDLERRLGVPKESTAKSYWAEQEGVSR